MKNKKPWEVLNISATLMDVSLLKTNQGCSTENGLSVERPEAEKQLGGLWKIQEILKHRSRNLNEKKEGVASRVD